MAQNFSKFSESDIVGKLYIRINNNEDAIRSNFSGTNFPLEPLVGQFFYSSEGKKYRYTIDNTWTEESYSNSDHNHTGTYSPIDHNHTGTYSPIDHNHTEFNDIQTLFNRELPIGSIIMSSTPDLPLYRRCDGSLCDFNIYTRLRDFFLAGKISASDRGYFWTFKGVLNTKLGFDFNSNPFGFINYTNSKFQISSSSSSDSYWEYKTSVNQVGPNSYEYVTISIPLKPNSDLMKSVYVNFVTKLTSTSLTPKLTLDVNDIIGLYTPNFRNAFPRAWQESVGSIGTYQDDTMQRIKGTVGQIRSDLSTLSDIPAGQQSAPFFNNGIEITGETKFRGTTSKDFMLAFMDTALSVRTDVADETRPKNISLPFLVYVGQ